MFGMRHYFFVQKCTFLALVLLLLVPAGAMAAKITDLWVTGAVYAGDQASTDQEKEPADSIHWWYSEKTRQYYLFLPSGTNIANLRVWFRAAEDSIDMGGNKVENGSAAGFLKPGGEMIVSSGSTHYTLKVMQSKNVPAMFIATESGSLQKIHANRSHKESGTMVMLNADGALEYDGKLTQIKGRGNSTFANPKKPYQIKLDEFADLCGMGTAKTWILLASYDDNSLLRNKIAFAMAKAAGLEYTSQTQAVDLYINNNYYGSYLLCEKVEIGASRVDIADLQKATEEANSQPLDSYPVYGVEKQFTGRSKGVQIPNDPEDITGGYLLELEKPLRYPDEISGFKTKKGLPVVIKEPEYASKTQAEYAKAMIQSFENAIFSDDGIDPASGRHYSELADVDSLVKKYILEEIAKNVDANRTSFFLYKPVDEKSTKFYVGPVWDYDIAFGNFAKVNANAWAVPAGFWANRDRAMPFYWFPALYAHADFYERVVSIYREAYVPAIKALLGLEKDPSGTVLSIDEYASEVEASAAMNFCRWQVFNKETRVVKTGEDYQENIDYLKDFLTRRMDFLDGNWLEK